MSICVATMIHLFACADAAKPETAEDTAAPGDAAADTAADTAETGAPPDTGPFDADGDGVFAGVDCDDADADVYPGAPDWCDAQDQDCDGVPIGDGMCGEVADVLAVGATEWWGPPEVFAVIPTEWTTSAGQLVGGVTYRQDEDGTVRGGGQIAFSAGGAEELGQDDFYLWPQDFDYTLGGVQVIGDFDGDGWNDLATGGGDLDGTYIGSVFLLSGDAADWTGSAEGYLPDTSMAWWQQEWGGDDFGWWVAGNGDVNGDGLADVFVHAPGLLSDGDLAGALYLMLGRTDGFPRGQDPTDELTFDHPRTWGESLDDALDDLAFVRDVDGDGADDLIAQVTFEDRRIGMASGATLLAADGADLEELFSLSTPFTGVAWSASSWEGGTEVGDVDGDGVADVVVDLVHEQGDVGRADDDLWCAGVLSGAALGTGADLWGAVLTELCEDDAPVVVGGYLGKSVADIDGDGLRDAFLGVAEERTPDQVCLLASSRFPTSGRGHLLEALGPCYAGDEDVIAEVAVADLTGDGVPELHLRHADRRGDGLDSILSLDGFVIPYDDPSKW